MRTHPASSALLAPRFYASMHANPVSPALHALASLPAVGTNTPAPARHTPTRCFAVLATALPRTDLAQLLQHAVQTPTAIRRPAKQVLVVVSEHLAETTPIAGTALGDDNGTPPVKTQPNALGLSSARVRHGNRNQYALHAPRASASAVAEAAEDELNSLCSDQPLLPRFPMTPGGLSVRGQPCPKKWKPI